MYQGGVPIATFFDGTGRNVHAEARDLSDWTPGQPRPAPRELELVPYNGRWERLDFSDVHQEGPAYAVRTTQVTAGGKPVYAAITNPRQFEQLRWGWERRQPEFKFEWQRPYAKGDPSDWPKEAPPIHERVEPTPRDVRYLHDVIVKDAGVHPEAVMPFQVIPHMDSATKEVVSAGLVVRGYCHGKWKNPHEEPLPPGLVRKLHCLKKGE